MRAREKKKTNREKEEEGEEIKHAIDLGMRCHSTYRECRFVFARINTNSIFEMNVYG